MDFSNNLYNQRFRIFIRLFFLCVCVSNSHRHSTVFSLHLPFSRSLNLSFLILTFAHTLSNIMTFANHLLIIDVRKMDGISIEPMDGEMKCFKALFMCACMCTPYIRVFLVFMCAYFLLIFFTISRARYVCNFQKKKTFSASVPIPCIGKIKFRKDP